MSNRVGGENQKVLIRTDDPDRNRRWLNLSAKGEGSAKKVTIGKRGGGAVASHDGGEAAKTGSHTKRGLLSKLVYPGKQRGDKRNWKREPPHVGSRPSPGEAFRQSQGGARKKELQWE